MTAVQTVQAKKRFLASFRKIGVISKAARAAKVGRQTHYDWLESDLKYARDFNDATEDAADALEAELVRRALDTEKLDTTALIVGLKMRGRFVERREFSGPGGGPMQRQIMTDEDRDIATRIASRRLAALN